jgi:cell filamentation protein
LETAERRLTAVRAAEIARGEAPIDKTWDLDHLKAIHRHLFQDVYEWAGELRTTELVRPSIDPNAPGNEFVKPEDIELAGRPTPEVVDGLTPILNGVNVLHPFIEGNGRSQRVSSTRPPRPPGTGSSGAGSPTGRTP